jgi:UDP-glucuronate 4-epimerase
MDYIEALENALGIKARKDLLPMQPGDILDTYADVQDLINNFGYKPATTVTEGIQRFAKWFLDYYA